MYIDRATPRTGAAGSTEHSTYVVVVVHVLLLNPDASLMSMESDRQIKRPRLRRPRDLVEFSPQASSMHADADADAGNKEAQASSASLTPIHRPRIDATLTQTHTDQNKIRVLPHLDEEGELLDAEGASGGEGIKGEVDGGATAGVPAAPGAAAGEGPALGRGDGGLAAVEELEHEDEHLVADGADGDDEVRRSCSSAGGRLRRRRRRRWVVGVEAAEELAEEEAARGEHAAVRVHQPAFHAEGHVAERLPVDEQVQVVEGERLERVLRAHDLMCRVPCRR